VRSSHRTGGGLDVRHLGGRLEDNRHARGVELERHVQLLPGVASLVELADLVEDRPPVQHAVHLQDMSPPPCRTDIGREGSGARPEVNPRARGRADGLIDTGNSHFIKPPLVGNDSYFTARLSDRTQ
jgi:hypothetical protein